MTPAERRVLDLLAPAALEPLKPVPPELWAAVREMRGERVEHCYSFPVVWVKPGDGWREAFEVDQEKSHGP